MDAYTGLSLPARGVWIEILTVSRLNLNPPSLPARGVWIEISLSTLVICRKSGRSPQGECGLKLPTPRANDVKGHVAPRKGSVD